ncbi:MAG: hypothetical protein WAM77_11875 [Xanthobacteraceae bacterium]
MNDFSDDAETANQSRPTRERPITIGVGVKAATIWRAAALLQDEHPIGEISRDATSGDRSPPDDATRANETLSDMSANVQAIVQRAASLVELQSVIQELQKLHDLLHTEGERLEKEISEYAQISKSATTATRAIADSILKFPTIQDMAAPVALEHVHRALEEPPPKSVSSDENSGRVRLALNWALARPIR